MQVNLWNLGKGAVATGAALVALSNFIGSYMARRESQSIDGDYLSDEMKNLDTALKDKALDKDTTKSINKFHDAANKKCEKEFSVVCSLTSENYLLKGIISLIICALAIDSLYQSYGR